MTLFFSRSLKLEVQSSFAHGSRNRMCAPTNWSKFDTSNWLSLLILKFYWSNFKLQLGIHGFCSHFRGQFFPNWFPDASCPWRVFSNFWDLSLKLDMEWVGIELDNNFLKTSMTLTSGVKVSCFNNLNLPRSYAQWLFWCTWPIQRGRK